MARRSLIAEDGGFIWKKEVVDEEESWAFPILAVDENVGKNLIEGGKIVTAAAAVAVKRVVDDKGKKKMSEVDEHELHIWTERERRRKMRDLFAALHALIPHLSPKADKTTIVTEAKKHIEALKQTRLNLEMLKKERREGGNANSTGCDAAILQPPAAVTPVSFSTWSSDNVVVNMCGYDAHINVICSAKKPGILSGVALVLDTYKLDLISAHVSSDSNTRNYMFHIRGNRVAQQSPEAPFVVQETFKQAASELMIWINSF